MSQSTDEVTRSPESAVDNANVAAASDSIEPAKATDQDTKSATDWYELHIPFAQTAITASGKLTTWTGKDDEFLLDIQDQSRAYPKDATPAISVQGVPLYRGLNMLMGIAGTGKTTTLELARDAARAEGFVCRHINMLEASAPTVNQCYTNRQFGNALTRVLLEKRTTLADGKPMLLSIDSLRLWSAVQSWLSPRLVRGGYDTALFASLTMMDSIMRAYGCVAVATLYLDELQLNSNDPANETATRAVLRTLLRASEGSTTSALLMGPTRKERGHYLRMDRYDRRDEPIGGLFELGSRDATESVTPHNDEVIVIDAAPKLTVADYQRRAVEASRFRGQPLRGERLASSLELAGVWDLDWDTAGPTLVAKAGSSPDKLRAAAQRATRSFANHEMADITGSAEDPLSFLSGKGDVMD